VSVLHVYHHATISFIWWMITYTAPGGDAYFSAALNSFVVRTALAPCSRLSIPGG
jgi:elongation of very long chain fatty acids protein 4